VSKLTGAGDMYSAIRKYAHDFCDLLSYLLTYSISSSTVNAILENVVLTDSDK